MWWKAKDNFPFFLSPFPPWPKITALSTSVRKPAKLFPQDWHAAWNLRIDAHCERKCLFYISDAKTTFSNNANTLHGWSWMVWKSRHDNTTYLTSCYIEAALLGKNKHANSRAINAVNFLNQGWLTCSMHGTSDAGSLCMWQVADQKAGSTGAHRTWSRKQEKQIGQEANQEREGDENGTLGGSEANLGHANPKDCPLLF